MSALRPITAGLIVIAFCGSLSSFAQGARAVPADVAPGPVLSETYSNALSAYTAGDFPRAGILFAGIVERDEKDPMTLKARYFLARTRMHRKQWSEASAELIAIYSISPSFFAEWGCDFLLGECRHAMGRD